MNVQLPIIKCKVQHATAHILLDTGSTANFVAENTKVGSYLINSFSKILERNVCIMVNGLNGKSRFTTSLIEISLGTPYHFKFNAFKVPHIQFSSEAEGSENFKGNNNKGHKISPTGSIDVLLGVVDTCRILLGKPRRICSGLFEMSSRLGPALCGAAGTETLDRVRNDQGVFLLSTLDNSQGNLREILARMWNIELMPLDNEPSTLTRDEAIAVHRVNDVLSYDHSNNRFITGLLWRDKPELLNNYKSARARFENLLKQLRANPKLKEAYVMAIREFFQMNVVESVSDPNATDPDRSDLFYLPHRPVYDENRVSTKCRPVFDASAKTPSKKSLNECLVPGPPLQINILAIEVRFRTNKFILIGDISKMFLQINVREEDRDFLRFLWKDPDAKGPPEIFRWKAVVFGNTDSPFLALNSLKRIIKMKLEDPKVTPIERRACQILDRDTYVDDITIASNDREEVVQLYHAVQNVLALGSFQVKKWASNDPEILRQLDQSTLAPTEIVNGKLVSSVTATLGVQWDPINDIITFAKNAQDHLTNEDTMTSVASLLAKPFDPAGIMSPFILKARFVMKRCHELSLKWRQDLPDELLSEWHRWVQQLPELEQLTFPRYVPFNETTKIVIFSDASDVGYGAVAYCYTFSKQTRKWDANILCARSRVAPLNRLLTLPQKELQAALVAAEIGLFLKEELKVPTENMIFFSDSEITLWWLTKPPDVLTPFVANRVSKIQGWNFKFQYVNTKENPADICSRSCDVSVLKGAFWQKGPTWLKLPINQWPKQKIDFSKIDRSDGMKKRHLFTYSNVVETVSLTSPILHPVNNPKKIGEKEIWPTIEELLKPGAATRISFEKYYSNYRDLIRRTAWIFFTFRKWKIFKRNNEGNSEARTNLSKFDGPVKINQTDLENAKLYWIRFTQRESFLQEILALESGQPLKKSSRLLAFDPFLDKQGILRVGGRLSYSELSREQKHPILLPKKHVFSKMLAWHAHVTNLHFGLDQWFFYLRQEYFILGARQLLRSLIRYCLTCKRLTKRFHHPQMSNLPDARLTLSAQCPPFTHVGTDLTGAITLKGDGRGQASKKAYIVIFTCMATRAIYADIMLSNQTQDFLMAFKRLVGTEGRPRYLYSDSASYYLRAKEEMKESFENLNEAMQEASREFGFSWHTNVPYAPHEGGVWERMVKTLKQCLLRVSRHAYLTQLEFTTVLKECTAILNDRPLVSQSASSLEVITPSLLSRGRLMRVLPDKFGDSVLPGSNKTRERWQHREAVIEHFFKLWKRNYVMGLQQRRKWFTPTPDIKEGDIVVLHKEMTKRGHWPLAKVVRVVRGRNDAVRHIELSIPQTDSKGKPKAPRIIERSVRYVCPLELAGSKDDFPVEGEEDALSITSEVESIE